MTPEDLETLLLDIESNSTLKVPQMFAGKQAEKLSDTP
jgi:hypothetical protein